MAATKKTNSTDKKKQNKASFADQFAALEKIVEECEANTLSLDDSLKKFEEGLKIAENLKGSLQEVENKIETLKGKYDAE